MVERVEPLGEFLRGEGQGLLEMRRALALQPVEQAAQARQLTMQFHAGAPRVRQGLAAIGGLSANEPVLDPVEILGELVRQAVHSFCNMIDNQFQQRRRA